MRPIPTMPTALALVLSLAAPAAAQDLSVEEIKRRLEAQAEALQGIEADGGLGATRGLGLDRGLELVTVDGPAPTAAAPQAEDTGATVAATPAAPTETASGEPVVLARFNEDLEVNLQVSFPFDSATIEESQHPVLDTMCEVIAGSDLERVRIIGHTDSAGTDDYNERLSRLRAEEVARYFVSECGIAETRLETMGMGERFPLQGADPAADANRRVEFQAMS